VKLTFLAGFVVILSDDFVLEREKQYFSLRVNKVSFGYGKGKGNKSIGEEKRRLEMEA